VRLCVDRKSLEGGLKMWGEGLWRGPVEGGVMDFFKKKFMGEKNAGGIFHR